MTMMESFVLVIAGGIVGAMMAPVFPRLRAKWRSWREERMSIAVTRRGWRDDFYARIRNVEKSLECTDATVRRHASNAEAAIQHMAEVNSDTELRLFDKVEELRPKPEGGATKPSVQAADD